MSAGTRIVSDRMPTAAASFVLPRTYETDAGFSPTSTTASPGSIAAALELLDALSDLAEHLPPR